MYSPKDKAMSPRVAWPRNGEAGDAAGPFVPGLVSMEKLENFYLVVSTIANTMGPAYKVSLGTS